MSDGNRVDEEHIDRVRVLTDLGALDSGDLLKAGAVDAVLLTEDADHEQLYVLVDSSGMDRNRIQIWSYSGCTKIDSAVVLAHFIRDNAPGTVIIVHRDRDYLNDAEVADLEEAFRKKGLRLFVTDGTDVESHFLSVAHVRQLHPMLGEEQIASAFEAATEETKDESVKSLARALFQAARDARRKEGRSGEPDIVAITDDARSRFDAAPHRWRHGKKTLGRAIGRLQQVLGENPNLNPERVNNFETLGMRI